MALEKVLHKIQSQVKDLTSTLELFMEENIQPSVNDCETLQHQINALEECLAIYKFQKKEKEISPSFNIHSKVSEKEKVENKQPEITYIEKATDKLHSSPTPVKETIQQSAKTPAPLTIGINDKFRFINELFKQNNAEYNIALEQLNGLHTLAETDLYLNSLKDLYEWEINSEEVIYFYSLVKKRFV
ncbi:MAG: hypothetical protein JWO32_26 [Bacteroidetes bacterium]|nr:hypothetical protein [Bacteroidota bacterium]